MTIALTKPGGWGINQKLKSSEATALDTNTIKALDRTAAGDTLLGVVTLASGAGLVLTSGSSITSSGGSVSLASTPVTLTSSALTVTGATLTSNTSLVAATSQTFTGTRTISGTTTFSGAGSVSVAQSLSVASAATFAAPVGFASSTSFSGASTFNSSVFIGGGPCTINGLLTVNANTTFNSSVNMASVVTDTLLIATSATISLTSRTKPKQLGLPVLSRIGGVDNWSILSSARIVQGTSASTPYVLWEVPIKSGATLLSATVIVRGFPGHAALPATKPALSVFVYEPSTDTTFATASVSDPSISIGAYETAHTITATYGGVVPAGTQKAYVLLTGEFGANALSGFVINGASYSGSYDQYDET